MIQERNARAAAKRKLSDMLLASSSTTYVDTCLLGKPEEFGGSDQNWQDWQFVTRVYVLAALPGVSSLLVEAENSDNDASIVNLSPRSEKYSTQLYYMLVLLMQSRALVRVQSAGQGEGALAWHMLQERWEPKTRSRWTSMLLGILNGKFRGDAQADIEFWECSVRSFERQASYTIPDFIKAGILINGLAEETLRSHMVMHTVRLDTYDRLKQEVT